MIFAAVATLSVLIGFMLGWVGRFTVFAATSLAIIAMAIVFGILGESGFGETTLLAILGFACLQIGYAGYLGFGAVRIARSRKTNASQTAANGVPPKEEAVTPTYEQSR